MRCYYCNKFGHYAHNRKKRIIDQGNHRANFTIESTKSMLLSCHTMHEPFDNVWLLDSGCNNHMTCNKNLVANLDQSLKTKVKLGTQKSMDVDGKGVVNILTNQGELKSVSEVYYVPSLKHNLKCWSIDIEGMQSYLSRTRGCYI